MTFRQCPQCANERFKGRYGTSSRISFTGSLAHQMFKRHLVSGPISVESFAQTCREEIGGNARLNNTLAELRLKPSEVNGAIEEVRALYERFVSYPEDGFVGAEVSFELEVATGLELVGQIDAVFTEGAGHRLVDWKTGGLGEADGQLIFYALLWALERGELPALLEAISVKTGERYSKTPSAADVSGIAVEIVEMADLIRTGWNTQTDLERRGGPWCRYCPVLEECPEGGATIGMLDR